MADDAYHGSGTEYDARAPYEGMSTGRYFATRFSSLKPPMLHVANPFKLLSMLNGQQWAFFSVAFIAWVRISPCCLGGSSVDAERKTNQRG